MKSLILAFALLLSAVTITEPDNQELIGSWRLVRFTRTIVATGQTVETFGMTPSGFIQFGSDGRMIMLIVKDERPNPPDPEKMTDQERAELFRTMIAYAGTYAFDGKNLECHLDVSWNQAWTGTDIQRHVTFEGRRLICPPVLTRATSMAT